MSETPEHPITKRVREAKERTQEIVSLIFDNGIPSKDDLRFLAIQHISVAAVGECSRVHASNGLYFEHAPSLNPPPKDGESFLIVFTDARGHTYIKPAEWGKIGAWFTADECRRSDEVYAVLRIPSELTELQRVSVDTERECIEDLAMIPIGNKAPRRHVVPPDREQYEHKHPANITRSNR